jgi:hypothetical protein
LETRVAAGAQHGASALHAAVEVRRKQALFMELEASSNAIRKLVSPAGALRQAAAAGGGGRGRGGAGRGGEGWGLAGDVGRPRPPRAAGGGGGGAHRAPRGGRSRGHWGRGRADGRPTWRHHARRRDERRQRERERRAPRGVAARAVRRHLAAVPRACVPRHGRAGAGERGVKSSESPLAASAGGWRGCGVGGPRCGVRVGAVQGVSRLAEIAETVWTSRRAPGSETSRPPRGRAPSLPGARPGALPCQMWCLRAWQGPRCHARPVTPRWAAGGPAGAAAACCAAAPEGLLRGGGPDCRRRTPCALRGPGDPLHRRPQSEAALQVNMNGGPPAPRRAAGRAGGARMGWDGGAAFRWRPLWYPRGAQVCEAEGAGRHNKQIACMQIYRGLGGGACGAPARGAPRQGGGAPAAHILHAGRDWAARVKEGMRDGREEGVPGSVCGRRHRDATAGFNGAAPAPPPAAAKMSGRARALGLGAARRSAATEPSPRGAWRPGPAGPAGRPLRAPRGRRSPAPPRAARRPARAPRQSACAARCAGAAPRGPPRAARSGRARGSCRRRPWRS